MSNDQSTVNYFEILGVGEDASLDEIEARYQELAGYLSSPDVPDHLREWAERQGALVDEAYAVLLDPDRRAAAAAGVPAPAAAAEPEPAPESPARKAPPARRAAAPARPPGAARMNPLLVGVLAGVAVIAVFFGGRMLLGGGDDDGDSSTVDAEAGVPLDTKRINELIGIVNREPSNAEALFELGESFFQANQFEKAIEWFNRLLAVDPNNVHARTDIGTSHFNMGRTEEAKKAWLDALKIDPDDVQLHYNMGFLYANSEPQDLEAAKREWEIVVKLDPTSNLAKTAGVHLQGISEEDMTPGAGTPAAGSPSPAASTSPGATP